MAVMLALAPMSNALAGTVYFEVAEPGASAVHRDSFVLPLSDPQHIAHARELVSVGPAEAGEAIVFATIAPGSDGVNRNLLAEGQPEWSWHVSAVQGFGDFGIELIDSWPTYVEANLGTWIAENDGAIGFWSYTVVRELDGYPASRPPPPPPPPNAIPLPAALPAGAAMLGGLGVVRLARRHGRRRRTSR